MPGHHIIVGGGLAGLTAAMKLAEQGEQVDLFSIVPVKRSHSVCAQGGINGAVNTKGEGDSPMIHFDDTIYGGDFLAHQPPVKAMCEAAPAIIYLFDRMGVMFNRTPEGLLDFRRFGGTKHHRTAFAGATTGQQLLYALDEQVRRYEVAGLIRKFEGWEMTEPRAGRVGRLPRHLRDRHALARDARVSRRHHDDRDRRPRPHLRALDAVAGEHRLGGERRAIRQGATYANGEFIQVHPTAMQGEDKYRLISESIRGEGGRVWTYRDGKPWYFLEEMYPAYGNLVPRDIATRAIHKVVYEMKLGVDGQPLVYLDVSHHRSRGPQSQGRGRARNLREVRRPGSAQSADEDFPRDALLDGRAVGRLQSADQHQGAVRGGECEFQYHGANRLGANSLLSCIYGGNDRRAGDDRLCQVA